MKGTWQTTDSGGSSGAAIAVIAAIVLIGSGAAAAIASALEVLLIAIGSTIGLAVIAGAGLLIWRARHNPPGRPISARVVAQIPPNSRQRLEESHKPAIGPAREVHLHLNISPDQLAAIMRHYTGEE